MHENWIHQWMWLCGSCIGICSIGSVGFISGFPEVSWKLGVSKNIVVILGYVFGLFCMML